MKVNVCHNKNNGNDAKQQKICSINNALKLSNTLEAHIASSNDCKNNSLANTEVNECDNKINANRTMLSILNITKESENYETSRIEDDMFQE